MEILAATQLNHKYKDTMASFPTGITVVTTLNNGNPVGATVSSFMSLSLNPPLVLLSLDSKRRLLKSVENFKAFAVNILPGNLEYVGRAFASQTSNEERFEMVNWDNAAETGCPVFKGCSWLDCELDEVRPGGDHHTVTGRVLDANAESFETALAYYRRTWLRVSAIKRGI